MEAIPAWNVPTNIKLQPLVPPKVLRFTHGPEMEFVKNSGKRLINTEFDDNDARTNRLTVTPGGYESS